MENDTITAIEGIRVGHAELDGIPSGCTVLLPDEAAPAGADIRGGAPGTFGFDSLHPLNLVGRLHGIFLSGGSAFGLSAADGMRLYLRERKIGFDTGYGVVPIVAGAIIFDLGMNRTETFPDSQLAYAACGRVSSEPVIEGSVGAGRGATIGKLFGFERCMKGGIGSSCIRAAGGINVGALVVVNALGEIVDPASGVRIAGARRNARSLDLADSAPELFKMTGFRGFPVGEASVIGVVATNAALNKAQLTKVAQMAHDGLARTVYPVHTQHDGDAIIALSCGGIDGAQTSMIGTLAAMAVAEAILRGVRKAESVEGIPAVGDMRTY
jgi:L-aminopeptidase/D-esterase-like protein